jgi:Tfp pilus assembly protein PilF
VADPDVRVVAMALLEDSAFSAAPKPPELEADPFLLSPEMQRYLQTQVAARVRSFGPREGLFEAIRNDLVLKYETSSTRTASEAFAARSGNCLSLVLMTAAFAKAMDMPVRYQTVYGHDSWSRVGGVAFLSGHVNVTLGQRDHTGARLRDSAPGLTIDFLLPEGGSKALHTRAIDEQTVLAMYRNNRAAEALAAGEVDAAYWWVRSAVLTQPTFNASYNTLGVIYRRKQLIAAAERALRLATAREPGNAVALANLADLLQGTGRAAEANQLRAQQAKLAQLPHYMHFQRGLSALKASRLEEAKTAFAAQLEVTPYDHEVIFALGMTELHLGEPRAAQELIQRALAESTTQDSQGIYAAKLDLIKKQWAPQPRGRSRGR